MISRVGPVGLLLGVAFALLSMGACTPPPPPPPPDVSEIEPQIDRVLIGDSVLFSVDASGQGGLVFEWRAIN